MNEDTGKLILRLVVGVLVLMHGVFKLQHPEAVAFVGGLFTKVGLPAFLAYTVFIGEVVAPIMLIVGYRVRLAGGLVALTMVVAILLAHAQQIFSLGMGGGWAIELQAMYLFGSLAIVGLGAGKYALKGHSCAHSGTCNATGTMGQQ